MPPTSPLPIWLARAIEAHQAGNIDGWMEIYAPDAIQEFPFAAEGAPRRLVGRSAIAAYLVQLPGVVHFGPFSYNSVREAGDDIRNVTFATPGEPYLALALDLDMNVTREMVDELPAIEQDSLPLELALVDELHQPVEDCGL